MSPAMADPSALPTLAPGSMAATGPPGSGPPPTGSSPPTDGFATVLNDEVARTATAEGQQKSVAPKQAGRRSHEDDVNTSAPSPASAGVAAAVSNGPVAIGATTLPAQPAPTGKPGADPPAVAAASDQAPATTPPTPATQTLAPPPTAPAVGAAALVATPAANGADTRDAKHDGPPEDPRDGAGAATPLPSTKAIGGQAVAAHADRAAATTAAASSASDPVLGTAGTSLTARSLPAAATSTSPYGSRLLQATEAVRATIELAARQGVTQARIQLSPASLGGVQIHLQHTSDGLVARVIADHPEAAAALAQNGDELRRQLQSGGTTLLRLDIGSSERRDTGQQDGSGSAGSGPSTRRDAGAEDPATSAVPATSGAVLTQLNLGANPLVNVLA